jgi:hypothetical protein
VIFLPIVERELRVASRKRSTFWVRVAAALVALLIGSAFLALSALGRSGFSSSMIGRGLFGALTWIGLAATLSAGLFFTSDCLSEEKREGTLGFLFLTDLSGYDVVLGKLLAMSVRGFYALLAVFPVLAVTLLMGGVTGAQFWKTALALLNALFVSMVGGLFVSAISRDSQKALVATLSLLVLWVAAGPAAHAAFAAVKLQSFNPILSLSSPGFLFVAAGAWGNAPFWRGLLVNQATAWTLLGLACFLLPRAWQDKGPKTFTALARWTHWWRFGGAKRRVAIRQELVNVNPVLWLACRERWQAAALWIVSLLMAGGFAALFATDLESVSWFLWSSFAGVLTLALYLGCASQACRFFVEAKRSGLIELLLATPLTAHQIVQGQWRALLRMFGPPLALCLAAQLLGAIMVQQMAWGRFGSGAPPPPPSTTATTNASAVTTTATRRTWAVSIAGSAQPNRLVTLTLSVATTLTVAANLAALTWFGMWMGLNSKTTNLATLKTIVFVQVIPWFVISFASALLIPLAFFLGFLNGPSGASTRIMTWFPLLSTGLVTVLDLAKDTAFALWARRKLYSEFRERAIQAVAPIRPALPPPLRRVGKATVIAPTAQPRNRGVQNESTTA